MAVSKQHGGYLLVLFRSGNVYFFGKNDAKAETPVLWPSCEELTHWKRL